MCPDGEESSSCSSKSSLEMNASEQHANHASGIDFSSVKVLENLHVKVGEAKHLVPGNRDTRNSYCSVCLDQEEVFKTRVIEKSLSPFFQEEFDFDIPHKFRLLCFNVHDVQEDVLSKRDHIYAKVAIKKTDIMNYNASEHWFPLTPVETSRDVQGQVYVDLKLNHYQSVGLNVEDGHKLTVRIPECSGLLKSGGNCDPYVSITLQGQHRSETKKTHVRKATTNPHFDEELVFELNKNHLRRSWFDLTLGGNEVKISEQEHWTSLTLKVAVYSSGTLGDEFLGETRIPLSSLIDVKTHAGWYLLQPRVGKISANGSKEDFGSIRVKITYMKDHVFPSHVYDRLLELLVSSVNNEPICSSWPHVIATVCGLRNRSQVARSLVRIFLQQNSLINLIEPIANDEISRLKDSNVVFRNSSFASCLIEETMRLIGSNYLANVLSPSLERIKSEKKNCEIDSSRLTPLYTVPTTSSTSTMEAGNSSSDPTQNNMTNLWEYVYQVVETILKTASQCPSVLCEIFNGLRNSATLHLPDDVNARYSAVANFIFLRFFASALLCPRKYRLIHEQLDANTTRTCTLVSKIVQHLCNMSMPRPLSTLTTASYVNTFCKKFVRQEHLDGIRNFIDVVSSSMRCLDNKGRSSSILERVMLKEGEMVKRAQGRTFLLSRKNFKNRYFALTNYDLSYGKTKASKPLCTIPVQDIRGVEKLQEESFKMSYMFQVIQPNRVLYCKASNSVEQKEWMDVLMKVCTCNRNRAQTYHPSAYVQGKYICCGSTTQKAPGCARVTGLPASLRLNTDLDRELERIYSLLSKNVDRIHKLQEECGARAVYVGPQVPGCNQFDSEDSVDAEDPDPDTETGAPPPNPPTFDVEDPQHTFRTLCAMLDCVSKLDNIHEEYARHVGDKDAEFGTQERPYGDS